MWRQKQIDEDDPFEAVTRTVYVIRRALFGGSGTGNTDKYNMPKPATDAP
jgi:hypothetical protein